MMEADKILAGKQILIVDDEPDVLESLIELLGRCKIDTANNFEEAKHLLESQFYDVAILDIMGVEGFDLLKIANANNIPSLMLTAHALTENNLNKAAKDGAAYFVPKDKMAEIDVFLADVLQSLEKKQSTWKKWFKRLGSSFDKRFHGTDWREKEKTFWENKLKQTY